MSYDQDPFEDPTPRVSQHTSAYSYRGRLILVEPTNIEHNVPKVSSQPNGPKGDKITATVTVLDGNGPVELYDRHSPTGRFLDGPVFRGVWFNQTQVTDALQSPDGKSLRKRVLFRLETLKPGTEAGPGNPWTVTAATPDEKKSAAAVLASLTVQSDESPF